MLRYGLSWLLVILWGLGTLDAAEAARRPNIIVILADDLGWSDLGCYGGEIPTPHIDRLAREGVRFTQFYNNAVCGPTRASLLTGLWCQQLGHRGTHWNDPIDFSRCVLISEVLRRAGYRTMMVGKWQRRRLAVDSGFDRFFGPMCQAKISYFHEVKHNPWYLDRQRVTLPKDFYLTRALNRYAVQFVEEALKQDRPFFLYVAHIAPHWPLHAPPEDIQKHLARYQAGWTRLREARYRRQLELGLVPPPWKLSPWPEAVPPWDQAPARSWQARRMAVYAAQVSWIDRGVGQLLQVLQRAGQLDNTVIFFLSDNGAAPDGGVAPSRSGFGFAPGRNNAAWRLDGVPIRPGSGPDNPPGGPETFAAYGLAWATVSNTPLRGTKLSGFEGGIRTPLIVHWPRGIRRPGAFCHQTGHVVDLMPTLIELAGAEYPRKLGSRRPLPLVGRSLVEAIRTGRRKPEPRWLFWSVPWHDAVRHGRWKAVRKKGSKRWMLFDLERDGTETTDLAAQYPKQLARLVERFSQWQVQVQRDARQNTTPADTRRPKAGSDR